MQTIRQFALAKLDAFRTARGMSDREFSLAAIGDHHFLARLRRGGSVTLARLERAERFIAAATPEEAQLEKEAA